ncbi:MAG: hypothetical protein J6S50_00605 [Oscillospiraceae bacterium]|nr:hypothetical protein [Oscillospiraceae bacterium]MBO7727002.1 hypothetical protein [Oscillospiraceae bacterium]MBP5281066.1 hypothetical protein [Lachnospiraceae bacterium]
MMNDDLISRKQAFDMIMGQPPEVHYPSWYADQIMGLPPAQKAEDLDRLIKALEQEHAKLREMQYAPDIYVGSKDTIYRQAAIDAVERAKTVRSEDGEIYCAKVNAQMNIHLLPSAHAQLELSEEDRRLLKKLRSFHNGSYAKVIDRLMSAQPEIIHCNDCQHSVYDAMFGDRYCHYNGKAEIVPDDHYCGYAERRTDG